MHHILFLSCWCKVCFPDVKVKFKDAALLFENYDKGLFKTFIHAERRVGISIHLRVAKNVIHCGSHFDRHYISCHGEDKFSIKSMH